METKQKKIEGYVDKERNIFVVTKDEDNIITIPPLEKSLIEEKQEAEKMRELFKKYKPTWMK